MDSELSKNLDRLSRMRAAAMSPDDMSFIRERLETAGMSEISAEPFETEGNDLPIAWSLTAKR